MSALWTALALASLLAARAMAEPIVRVRAESRIELGASHRGGMLFISGALRDELGAALEDRAIAVEATPENAPDDRVRTEVTTGPGGRFSLELPDGARDYRLLAVFAGDPTHRGVRVERGVERGRADVRLELRLPTAGQIDLDASTLPLEVLAESDAGGDNLTMRLSNEAGEEIAQGVTSAEGTLALEVPTSKLGPEGPGVLRIESLRDAQRAEAQTEVRVVRQRALHVSLQAETPSLETGRALPVSGRVWTQRGPRPTAPVGLFADGQHVETVLTDAQGRYAAELWIDAEPGRLRLTARAEGDAAGAFLPAETHAAIGVEAARPVPLGWLAAALLVALALLLLRRRPSGAAEPEESLRPAIAGSKIAPAAAKGRRDRFQVRGRVVDQRNGQALAGATVSMSMSRPALTATLVADEEGRFCSPDLPVGSACVRVQAPGFVPTEVTVELPHRGEWSDFTVRLESLRARALAPFRQLALEALPSPRAWAIATSREAQPWIARRTGRASADLDLLTLEVERACYGRDAPSERDVRDLEARVALLDRSGDASPTRKPGRPRAAR